jgi:hypothetical protein
VRIGNINLVFRGSDPERHRVGQRRFARAAWSNLITAVICAVIATVANSTLFWWLAGVDLAVSLLSWLLARVPPKTSPRGSHAD